MNICFNLLVSSLHFVLTYGLFLTIMLSNNIHLLVVVFVVLLGIRYSYYMCGRCVLTLAEDNDSYPNLVTTCSHLLANGLDDTLAEEILINVGLLAAINKLFVLMLLQKHGELGWPFCDRMK